MSGTKAGLKPMDGSIFAPEVVGARYKKRLKEIWAKRNVNSCLFTSQERRCLT